MDYLFPAIYPLRGPSGEKIVTERLAQPANPKKEVIILPARSDSENGALSGELHG